VPPNGDEAAFVLPPKAGFATTPKTEEEAATEVAVGVPPTTEAGEGLALNTEAEVVEADGVPNTEAEVVEADGVPKTEAEVVEADVVPKTEAVVEAVCVPKTDAEVVESAVVVPKTEADVVVEAAPPKFDPVVVVVVVGVEVLPNTDDPGAADGDVAVFAAAVRPITEADAVEAVPKTDPEVVEEAVVVAALPPKIDDPVVGVPVPPPKTDPEPSVDDVLKMIVIDYR
jgi:hypothetical protein